MQPLHLSALNKGDSGFEGITYMVWNPLTNIFIDANVTINTYYASSFTNNRRRAIWTHELGHGVGLDHSASSAVMMYKCASCVFLNYGYYTPQPDDVAGVNAIY